MNKNMRKMYSEQEIVNLVKKNLKVGTKLYLHKFTFSGGTLDIISEIGTKFNGSLLNPKIVIFINAVYQGNKIDVYRDNGLLTTYKALNDFIGFAFNGGIAYVWSKSVATTDLDTGVVSFANPIKGSQLSFISEIIEEL